MYVCLFFYLSLRSFINSSSYFHKYRNSIQKRRKGIYIRLLLSNKYIAGWSLFSIPVFVVSVAIWISSIWFILKLGGLLWLKLNPFILYPMISVVVIVLFILVPTIVLLVHQSFEFLNKIGSISLRILRYCSDGVYRVFSSEPYYQHRQMS